jgi:hypothetical protein
MLLESLATAGRSIAVIAFKDVSWEINVLLEGQLAAKPPTALGRLGDDPCGIDPGSILDQYWIGSIQVDPKRNFS